MAAAQAAAIAFLRHASQLFRSKFQHFHFASAAKNMLPMIFAGGGCPEKISQNPSVCACFHFSVFWPDITNEADPLHEETRFS